MGPHPRSVVSVVGLVIASCVLAACAGAVAPATVSGDTQSQQAGDSGGQNDGAVALPSVCSLLTNAEIQAQFTFEMAPPVDSGGGTGATSPDCNWKPVEFQPTFGGVQVIVQKFDQGYFDFIKGPTAIDVAGLGDAAFWSQPTNPFTLQMKKGNLHFSLYVVAGSNDPPESVQQKVINLANNVLAHL